MIILLRASILSSQSMSNAHTVVHVQDVQRTTDIGETVALVTQLRSSLNRFPSLFSGRGAPDCNSIVTQIVFQLQRQENESPRIMPSSLRRLLYEIQSLCRALLSSTKLSLPMQLLDRMKVGSATSRVRERIGGLLQRLTFVARSVSIDLSHVQLVKMQQRMAIRSRELDRRFKEVIAYFASTA